MPYDINGESAGMDHPSGGYAGNGPCCGPLSLSLLHVCGNSANAGLCLNTKSSVQKLNAKTGDSFMHVPKFAQSRAWFASTPMGTKKTRAFVSCCRTARRPCRATRIC